MSSPRRTDPLMDRLREPDELRRLNLELDSAGGAMWPWMIGLLAAIIVEPWNGRCQSGRGLGRCANTDGCRQRCPVPSADLVTWE
jgi:hypothetical protein